jgi:hypothetical protein
MGTRLSSNTLLAVTAAFALLLGACESGSGGLQAFSDAGVTEDSTSSPPGPDSGGTEREAPPHSTEGKWSVPSGYAEHAGGSGGGSKDGAATAGGGYHGGVDAGAAMSDSFYMPETSEGPGSPDYPEPGDPTDSEGDEDNRGEEVKAGAYDDNADFEAYLAYLETHAELSEVLAVDVAERYVVTVMDGATEKAVPDADVRFSVGGKTVATAQTNARGQMLFHPALYNVSDAVTAFEYEVSAPGQEPSTGSFQRAEGGAEVYMSTNAPAGEADNKIGVDVALVLDTTGSMSDEIDRLKRTWQDVAEAIAGLSSRVDLRFALVVYRDRGEEYVVKYHDFTPDVDAFVEALGEVRADGGGDMPEDMQAALDVTVNYLEWRADAKARVAFVLADAPPHLYEQAFTYVDSVKTALQDGIRVHGIGASGATEQAEYILRQLAQMTMGHFLFLTYSNDIPGQPGSGTGSGGEDGYSVGEYLSGSLDELVVQLVGRDVLALVGE